MFLPFSFLLISLYIVNVSTSSSEQFEQKMFDFLLQQEKNALGTRLVNVFHLEVIAKFLKHILGELGNKK